MGLMRPNAYDGAGTPAQLPRPVLLVTDLPVRYWVGSPVPVLGS